MKDPNRRVPEWYLIINKQTWKNDDISLLKNPDETMYDTTVFVNDKKNLTIQCPIIQNRTIVILNELSLTKVNLKRWTFGFPIPKVKSIPNIEIIIVNKVVTIINSEAKNTVLAFMNIFVDTETKGLNIWIIGFKENTNFNTNISITAKIETT